MPKRKSEVRPGPNVGGPSPKDDSLPQQALRRGQTIRTGARGRSQPAGRPPTNAPRAPRGGR